MKQTTTQTTIRRPRTKTIPGFRVQPGLSPMHRLGFPYLGIEILDAEFTEYDGMPCVEVLARIGNGVVKGPYTLVLSIDQARAADIIEVA